MSLEPLPTTSTIRAVVVSATSPACGPQVLAAVALLAGRFPASGAGSSVFWSYERRSRLFLVRRSTPSVFWLDSSIAGRRGSMSLICGEAAHGGTAAEDLQRCAKAAFDTLNAPIVRLGRFVTSIGQEWPGEQARPLEATVGSTEAGPSSAATSSRRSTALRRTA